MNAFRIAVAALIVGSTAGGALAQTANRIGTYKDWGAYTFMENKAKVCYVASQPKTQDPKGLNRDPAYFMITARPSQNVKSEISIIIGYRFKDGSKVTAEVDAQKFTLFTKADGAWIENAAEETAMIAAMKKGHSLTVAGTSSRGTATTDSYSLSGISAALDALAKACP